MRLNDRIDDLETTVAGDDAAVTAYRDQLSFMARISGNRMQVLHDALRPVPDFMVRTRLLYDAYLRSMQAEYSPPLPQTEPRGMVNGMVHGCPLGVDELHTLYPPAWFKFHDENVLDYIRGHEERNHQGHPVPWGRDGRVIKNVLEDTDDDVEEARRIQAKRTRERYLASLQDEVRDHVMRRPPL